ncbi:MAG: hypothetical protein ACFFCI_24385, partial [Promethearchaeota archaeon]
MTDEKIIDLIRMPRRRLAILYEATMPYNDEDCYIKITSHSIRFSTLSPIVAFEYHIPRTKQMDITRIDLGRKIPDKNFVTNVDNLNIHLAPFSKPSGSESAKKASDIVFFEFGENKCRFSQQSIKFIGEWLNVKEEKVDLWHLMPNIDLNEALDGVYFKDAVNRISSTKESKICLLVNNNGIFIKSKAGRERVGRKSKSIGKYSIKLPRIQLQRACNLMKNFSEFWVSVSQNHLILIGKHENTLMKLLIYGLKEN